MGKEKPVEGKFVTSVKVGPKGQIIVPKEVRDMFNIQPGDMLLMLADVEQGIAIQTFNTTNEMFEICFRERNNLWRIYCRASFRGAVFFCRKSKTCKTCIDFHRLTRYNANMVLQVKLITL